MDCSPQGSSVPGILQARILEWVAISFSRGSSRSRDRTWVSCIAGRCFTLWATRELGKVILKSRAVNQTCFFFKKYFKFIFFSEVNGKNRVVKSNPRPDSWAVGHLTLDLMFVLCSKPSPMLMTPRQPSWAMGPASSSVSPLGPWMNTLLCSPLLQLSNSHTHFSTRLGGPCFPWPMVISLTCTSLVTTAVYFFFCFF